MTRYLDKQDKPVFFTDLLESVVVNQFRSVQKASCKRSVEPPKIMFKENEHHKKKEIHGRKAIDIACKQEEIHEMWRQPCWDGIEVTKLVTKYRKTI